MIIKNVAKEAGVFGRHTKAISGLLLILHFSAFSLGGACMVIYSHGFEVYI